MRAFTQFLIKKGVLTLTMTFLIVLSIRAIGLQDYPQTWTEVVSIFLFVLIITTLFLFVIYWQSHKLRSEQELFTNVFQHSPDGIVLTDSELNIIRMNSAARQLLNMEEDPVTVQFCAHCSNYAGLNKLCSYQQCFVTEPEAGYIEVQLKAANGVTRSMKASVSQYKDPVYGLLHIVRFQEVEKARQIEQRKITKMITHSILSAQENERKRISRELHDGIGQSLYSILIQTEVLKTSLVIEESSPAENQMEELQESIRHTIEDIRDLSVELRPSALDDIGLVAALRNYVRLYGQKFGIQVVLTIEGDSGLLPSAHEIAFYRIIQEALINAAKYSQTEVVEVKLKVEDPAAELQIQDYGVGFELTQEQRQGVGIYSMEERVNILQGEFEIESVPGKGTYIAVKVPLS